MNSVEEISTFVFDKYVCSIDRALNKGIPLVRYNDQEYRAIKKRGEWRCSVDRHGRYLQFSIFDTPILGLSATKFSLDIDATITNFLGLSTYKDLESIIYGFHLSSLTRPSVLHKELYKVGSKLYSKYKHNI